MTEIIVNQKEITIFKKKCQEAIKDIQWSHGTPFQPNITIVEALKMARNGEQFCKETIDNLEPKGENHAEWMNFIHLLTILYNRNKEIKKYTILRKRMLITNMHKCRINHTCFLIIYLFI